MEVRNSGVLRTIPLLIAVCLVSFPAQAQYGGGSGEPNDPYLIYTAEQMNAIGAEPNDWDKHFKLMADIDLSKYTGTDFNMIGYWVDLDSPDNRSFRGVFDGNGHTISNFIYFNTERDDNIGLFGCVEGENAEIKNLGLIDPNVDAGTANYVGSLVGWLWWWGTITNCYVEGGSVLGEDHIGGMVGRNSGTIINCYANGSVMGNGYVGGMVGYNYGIITNCCAGSVVIGNKNVGGMVGRHGRDYPPFSPNLGRDLVFLGPRDKISNCYSTSDVSGGDRVGGLAGEQTLALGSTITNCYSTGSVSGNDDVGGLVGAIAFPPLPGMDLYGITPDTISDFYSTADITGDGGVGQLVRGVFIPDVNSFWDTETSGQHTSALGIGKTTAEMQTASTFLEAGWDFVGETANGTEDIWWILEGQDYPRLWWQLFWAVSPYPQDGATDVAQPLILNWAPGRGISALYHIYLGEDLEAVKNATIGSPEYKSSTDLGSESYDPGKLEWDTTYYWRIDEVKDADTDSPWPGILWSFTTADFLIVDDFESYNDFEPGNRIFNTWIDGYDDLYNGSLVGYEEPPFAEVIITHTGKESMSFHYDNSVGYSEATANVDNLAIGQDWTESDVETLSLWFYVRPGNAPEPMYVALANSSGSPAVVFHNNPYAAMIDTWTEWRIDLQEFANQGVDLTNINTISIGFGDKDNPVAGGSGTMYFDDIRLYQPQEPEPAP